MSTITEGTQNNAQDAGDMGIAYVFNVRARQFYKSGVRENETIQAAEIVVIRDTDDSDNIAGRILYDLSGGVIVADDKNEEMWHISPKELWDGYIEMRSTMQSEDK